ncbi:MAG: type III secretion system outer membrane ring subunit SctC [Candidatus Adiutrix sp.]|jgi:type III secretion protein C|nr:type III secretion system outer membrane ring subunit SctC [Candidatus Adiutrix sp.]
MSAAGRRRAALVLGLALTGLALGAGRLEAQGRSSPLTRTYTHFSRQEPLRLVVADFARVQGYRAEISPAVEGVVNGRFEEVEPLAFLSGLEAAFGLRWYQAGPALHFYHESEESRLLLQPRHLSPAQLFEQLNALGAAPAQLPLQPPRGQGPLTVTGPPDYLETLKATAEALDQPQTRDTRTVMRVFKLKNATADDQVISSLGRTVTIPGVASILRAMLAGPGQGPAGTGTLVTQDRATVGKLKGSGLIALGAEPEPAAPTGAGGPLNIMADPRVNAVVIQDLPDRMPYYETVIADLDQPVHLVEIHAAIVDIDTDFKRDLGIVWQGTGHGDAGWSGGGEISGSGDAFNLQPNPGNPSGLGLAMSTIYTRGDRYFLARIQALEKDGEARMLGRPSVLTADNLEATLENITTYYIPVSGQDEVDLFKVESGTVLRVTPHIIENAGRPPSIKLAVTVQDDQNPDNSIAGNTSGLPVPPIKQTKINTQAIIEVGQSLLIGGYYFEERKGSEAGVPGLKNVPVLGHLFKNSSKETRKMERLVLITPRVVRLGEAPVPPAYLDDPGFSRSPTQAHYEPREPEPRPAGGCRRR